MIVIQYDNMNKNIPNMEVNTYRGVNLGLVKSEEEQTNRFVWKIQGPEARQIDRQEDGKRRFRSDVKVRLSEWRGKVYNAELNDIEVQLINWGKVWRVWRVKWIADS